jgi:hypothetical protein
VVESAKEAVADVGASAWAGKEKSKAVAQEKLAKARAHDPAEKVAADARAQERVRDVEAAKQDTMHRHAAAKHRHTAAVHQPSLPEPPARAVPDTLPVAPLVKARDDGGCVTDAAPNATETGAPEAAVVNDDDAPQSGTAGTYPTAETGRHP